MEKFEKSEDVRQNKRKTESFCDKLKIKVAKSENEDLESSNQQNLLEKELNRVRVRTNSEMFPKKIQSTTNSNNNSHSLSNFPLITRKRHFSSSDASFISRDRHLLGNFTESALNGRLNPVNILDGFRLQLAANGPSFCSPHINLPVTVYFFDLNTTGCEYFPSKPVPYLGKCILENYRIPNKGTLQVTLFNPQKTIIKVFVTNYNVEDIPPNSKTFIRHIWQWKATKSSNSNNETAAKNLQYLIHFRLMSNRRCRVFLHTDIRILFSQDSTVDALLLPQVSAASNSKYEICDYIETPSNPLYSK